ncbi:hypothetical protein J6590_074114 [Homalodisca vitripennis]|nr:hypothetical protein J6590_074114 [Homalodisca vitripennis]
MAYSNLEHVYSSMYTYDQEHQWNAQPDNQEPHRLASVVENSSMKHSMCNNVASPSHKKLVNVVAGGVSARRATFKAVKHTP